MFFKLTVPFVPHRKRLAGKKNGLTLVTPARSGKKNNPNADSLSRFLWPLQASKSGLAEANAVSAGLRSVIGTSLVGVRVVSPGLSLCIGGSGRWSWRRGEHLICNYFSDPMFARSFRVESKVSRCSSCCNASATYSEPPKPLRRDVMPRDFFARLNTFAVVMD
jgi:hypothetical protein